MSCSCLLVIERSTSKKIIGNAFIIKDFAEILIFFRDIIFDIGIELALLFSHFDMHEKVDGKNN